MSTLTSCMSVHHLHDVLGGQKKLSESLETELWMVASHHDPAMDAGNPNQSSARAVVPLTTEPSLLI